MISHHVLLCAHEREEGVKAIRKREHQLDKKDSHNFFLWKENNLSSKVVLGNRMPSGLFPDILFNCCVQKCCILFHKSRFIYLYFFLHFGISIYNIHYLKF